ncbi:MAG: sugar phosphate isomerase/epimerase, partial [Anaerolineales bacterium]|nr:sugar phosphate isomerase/epimerase [Anaerolineales bacterium]
LDAVIAKHELWGCSRVGLGHMPREFISADEADFLAFAKILNEIGARLHAAGLSFHYHNHSFEFVRFGDRNGLELLFAETNPAYVKAILDTYWVQHGGADSVDWVHRLAGRMDVIHLKDMVIQERQQVMAEVGQGNLNWPGILAACAETGVAYAAVEQDICQRDPFESMAMSYNYLKEQGLS